MFRNPATDLILVVVVLLVIFGPKRLPIIGRELGRGLREFKDSITGGSKDSGEPEQRPGIPPAAGQTRGAAGADSALASEPDRPPADGRSAPRP